MDSQLPKASVVPVMPPPPLPPRGLPRLHTLGMAPSGTTIDSRGQLQSYSGPASSTPIRPRPVMASASSFSFDSGLEVSPMCLRSFDYSPPPPLCAPLTSELMANNNNNNNNHGTCDRAQCTGRHNCPADNAEDNLLSGDEQEGDTDNSMEGYDKELEAITEHYFTPISTTFTNSVSQVLVSGPTTATNLAVQRRSNRVMLQQEMNNNDVNHANAYDASDSYFDVFDMEIGEDDVFLSQDEEQQHRDEMNVRSRPPRPLVLADTDIESDDDLDPCCPMDPGHFIDFTDPSNRYALAVHPERCPRFVAHNDHARASTSSRRSSTPITIPSSRNSVSSCSPFATANVAAATYDDDEFVDGIVYSVPRPTHLPYYHPMAPSLPMNPPVSAAISNESDAQQQPASSLSSVRIIQPQHHRTDSNSSARSTSSSNRRTPFGSRLKYESTDIVSRNIVNSSGCFSPPPMLFNWYRQSTTMARGSDQHRLFMRFTPTLERRYQTPLPLDGSAGRLGRAMPIMRPLANSTATVFFSEDYFDEDDVFNNGFETLSEDDEGEAAEEAEMRLLQQRGEQLGASQTAHQVTESNARKASILRHTASMRSANSSRAAEDNIGAGYRYRRVNRRTAKHRNTVTSIEMHTHATPSSGGNTNKLGNGGRTAGGAYSPYQTYPIASQRRTMSVSFPIDETSMRRLGSELRQISDNFESQVARLSPSLFSSLLDIFVANMTRGETRHNTKSSAGSTTPRTAVDSGSKQAKKTNQVPLPTTTGNSTFYVSTCSGESSDEGAATGSDQD